jgi:glycosyltransferase involved in cell wall biosynthesis
MKILHLISQHPESTGSGFYIQNLMRQADAAGHRNFLVAGISGQTQPQLDSIMPSTCRFVYFEKGRLGFTVPGMSDIMPYPSSVFGKLTAAQLDLYELEFAEAISHAVEVFEPDIIHSHHLWLVTAVARQRFPDMAMVTSCHSTDLRQFQQCPHLRDRVLPYCQTINRILALSRNQASLISQLYGITTNQIDVVGGGFDEGRFVLHEKKASAPVQLLYAGKLSFAKGVDVLLRAIQTLGDGIVHLHLAGSGTGAEERHCLALAEQAGAMVTIHGRLTQQELARIMGRCHLFILPSFYEGLPLVLLEALASGCRIITTDLAGCRELLDAADPDLVEFVELPILKEIDRPNPQDLPIIEERLKSAILSMVDRIRVSCSPDPQAIRQFTSSFSWEAVFRRVTASYRKVLSS